MREADPVDSRGFGMRPASTFPAAHATPEDSDLAEFWSETETAPTTYNGRSDHELQAREPIEFAEFASEESLAAAALSGGTLPASRWRYGVGSALAAAACVVVVVAAAAVPARQSADDSSARSNAARSSENAVTAANSTLGVSAEEAVSGVASPTPEPETAAAVVPASRAIGRTLTGNGNGSPRAGDASARGAHRASTSGGAPVTSALEPLPPLTATAVAPPTADPAPPSAPAPAPENPLPGLPVRNATSAAEPEGSARLIPISVSVRADAVDPDGDPLTFRWGAPAGIFEDSTARETLYTCPSTPGDVSITVTVVDSRGGKQSDTMVLRCVLRTP